MEMKSRIQEKFKTLYGTDGEMFASPDVSTLSENIPTIMAVMYFPELSIKVS